MERPYLLGQAQELGLFFAFYKCQMLWWTHFAPGKITASVNFHMEISMISTMSEWTGSLATLALLGCAILYGIATVI